MSKRKPRPGLLIIVAVLLETLALLMVAPTSTRRATTWTSTCSCGPRKDTRPRASWTLAPESSTPFASPITLVWARSPCPCRAFASPAAPNELCIALPSRTLLDARHLPLRVSVASARTASSSTSASTPWELQLRDASSSGSTDAGDEPHHLTVHVCSKDDDVGDLDRNMPPRAPPVITLVHNATTLLPFETVSDTARWSSGSSSRASPFPTSSPPIQLVEVVLLAGSLTTGTSASSTSTTPSRLTRVVSPTLVVDHILSQPSRFPFDASDAGLYSTGMWAADGVNVVNVGDLNGDGLVDVAWGVPKGLDGRGYVVVRLSRQRPVLMGDDDDDAGSSSTDAPSSTAAATLVVLLPDQPPPQSLSGGGSSSESIRLGTPLFSVGDFNGDGFDDVGVGSLRGGSTVVRVVFGGRSVAALQGHAPASSARVVAETAEARTDPQPTSHASVNATLETLLSSLPGVDLVMPALVNTETVTCIGLGDFNGDGLADVACALVGIAKYSLHVVLGSRTETAAALADGIIVADQTSRVWTSRCQANCNVGHSKPLMAPLGDVNGDGLADFLTTIPKWGNLAVLVPGWRGFAEDFDLLIDAITFQHPSWSGPVRGVATLFDFDGDGAHLDTAFYSDEGLFVQLGGRPTLLLGGTLCLGTGQFFHAYWDTVLCERWWPGVENHAVVVVRPPPHHKIVHVAPVADLDSDGCDDLVVVVAPRVETPESHRSLYTLFGSPAYDVPLANASAPATTDVWLADVNGVDAIVSPLPPSFRARLAAGVGDLDEDGFPDVAVSEGAATVLFSGLGRARSPRASLSTPVLELTGNASLLVHAPIVLDGTTVLADNLGTGRFEARNVSIVVDGVDPAAVDSVSTPSSSSPPPQLLARGGSLPCARGHVAVHGKAPPTSSSSNGTLHREPLVVAACEPIPAGLRAPGRDCSLVGPPARARVASFESGFKYLTPVLASFGRDSIAAAYVKADLRKLEVDGVSEHGVKYALAVRLGKRTCHRIVWDRREALLLPSTRSEGFALPKIFVAGVPSLVKAKARALAREEASDGDEDDDTAGALTVTVERQRRGPTSIQARLINSRSMDLSTSSAIPALLVDAFFPVDFADPNSAVNLVLTSVTPGTSGALVALLATNVQNSRAPDGLLLYHIPWRRLRHGPSLPQQREAPVARLVNTSHGLPSSCTPPLHSSVHFAHAANDTYYGAYVAPGSSTELTRDVYMMRVRLASSSADHATTFTTTIECWMALGAIPFSSNDVESPLRMLRLAATPTRLVLVVARESPGTAFTAYAATLDSDSDSGPLTLRQAGVLRGVHATGTVTGFALFASDGGSYPAAHDDTHVSTTHGEDHRDLGRRRTSRSARFIATFPMRVARLRELAVRYVEDAAIGDMNSDAAWLEHEHLPSVNSLVRTATTAGQLTSTLTQLVLAREFASSLAPIGLGVDENDDLVVGFATVGKADSLPNYRHMHEMWYLQSAVSLLPARSHDGSEPDKDHARRGHFRGTTRTASSVSTPPRRLFEETSLAWPPPRPPPGALAAATPWSPFSRTLLQCPRGYYCPHGAVAPLPCPGGGYTSAAHRAGLSSVHECENLACAPGFFCGPASVEGTTYRRVMALDSIRANLIYPASRTYALTVVNHEPRALRFVLRTPLPSWSSGSSDDGLPLATHIGFRVAPSASRVFDVTILSSRLSNGTASSSLQVVWWTSAAADAPSTSSVWTTATLSSLAKAPGAVVLVPRFVFQVDLALDVELVPILVTPLAFDFVLNADDAQPADAEVLVVNTLCSSQVRFNVVHRRCPPAEPASESSSSSSVVVDDDDDDDDAAANGPLARASQPPWLELGFDATQDIFIDPTLGKPARLPFRVRSERAVLASASTSSSTGSASGSAAAATPRSSCLAINITVEDNGRSFTLERIVELRLTPLKYCPPGHTSASKDNRFGCEPCALGSFQSRQGESRCEPCPVSLPLTLKRGAATDADCVAAPGFYKALARSSSTASPTSATPPVTLNPAVFGGVDRESDDDAGAEFGSPVHSGPVASTTSAAPTMQRPRTDVVIARFEGLPCPTGANCTQSNLTLATLPALRGYWRSSSSSSVFVPCAFASYCVGDGEGRGNARAGAVVATPDGACREHHTGILCETCINGSYSKRGPSRHCSFCSAEARRDDQLRAAGVLVGVLLALLAVVSWLLYRFTTKARDGDAVRMTVLGFDVQLILSKLKIIIGVFQVVAGIVRSSPSAFPPAFVQVATVFTAFAFNVRTFFDFGCAFPSSHAAALVASTLVPFVVAFIIVALRFLIERVVLWVWARRERTRGPPLGGEVRRRPPQSEARAVSSGLVAAGSPGPVSATGVAEKPASSTSAWLRRRFGRCVPRRRDRDDDDDDDDDNHAGRSSGPIGSRAPRAHTEGSLAGRVPKGALRSAPGMSDSLLRHVDAKTRELRLPAADPVRTKEDEIALRADLNEAAIGTMLFTLFLVYPGVTQLVLQSFVCDTFDGGASALAADHSVMCVSGRDEWTFIVVWASVSVVVYVIGVPALFLAILLWGHPDSWASRVVVSCGARASMLRRAWCSGEVVDAFRNARRRSPGPQQQQLEQQQEQEQQHHAQEQQQRQRRPTQQRHAQLQQRSKDAVYSRFLWDAYHLPYFYWEVVELARKSLQVGVVSYFSDVVAMQMVAQLAISVVYLVVLVDFKPYRSGGDNLLASLVQLNLVGIVVTALLISLSKSIERGLSESALNAALMLMLFLSPAFALVQLLIAAWQTCTCGWPRSRRWLGKAVFFEERSSEAWNDGFGAPLTHRGTSPRLVRAVLSRVPIETVDVAAAQKERLNDAREDVPTPSPAAGTLVWTQSDVVVPTSDAEAGEVLEVLRRGAASSTRAHRVSVPADLETRRGDGRVARVVDERGDAIATAIASSSMSSRPRSSDGRGADHEGGGDPEMDGALGNV